MHYNFPEPGKETTDARAETADRTMEVVAAADAGYARLGKPSPEGSKPRPLRLRFRSQTDKHDFVVMAKALRTMGIRCDDDLTRAQQKEREDLSADFLELKSKGYSPFFRGSQLRYRSHEKVLTCKRNQSHNIQVMK